MFGHAKKVDPKEAARDAKRAVRTGERDIEKELRNLDRQEKILIIDIKKTAKTGNEKATRSMASQLVGLRNHRDKLYSMKAGITAVGYQTTAMASNAAMAGVMGNIGAVMKQANDNMSAADTAKIMAEFARQNEVMGMREDMIDDALTDAFDGDTEQESNAIVDQVLTEIGLETTGKMIDAPSGRPAGAKNAVSDEDAQLDQRAEELLKQLQAL